MLFDITIGFFGRFYADTIIVRCTEEGQYLSEETNESIHYILVPSDAQEPYEVLACAFKRPLNTTVWFLKV